MPMPSPGLRMHRPRLHEEDAFLSMGVAYSESISLSMQFNLDSDSIGPSSRGGGNSAAIVQSQLAENSLKVQAKDNKSSGITSSSAVEGDHNATVSQNINDATAGNFTLVQSQHPDVSKWSSNNGTISQLMFVGCNETTGEPIYGKPCASNDNPVPYDWNCTDVPTGMPTYSPTIDRSFGSDRNNGREDNGESTDGVSSSGGGGDRSGDPDVKYGTGRLVYECASSKQCNLYRPPCLPLPLTDKANSNTDGNNADEGLSGTKRSDKGIANGNNSDEHDNASDALINSTVNDGFDVVTSSSHDETNPTKNVSGIIGYATSKSTFDGGDDNLPWTFLGPCNFHSSTCPDRYATKKYSAGDQVSVVVDRWVYTCMGSDCNHEMPSLAGTAGDEESQAGNGKSQSGKAGKEAGSRDDVALSSSDRSLAGLRDNVSSNDIVVGATAGNSAGVANGKSQSSASLSTGRSSGEEDLGWKLTGGCQVAQLMQNCPEEYDAASWYFSSDKVSVAIKSYRGSGSGSIWAGSLGSNKDGSSDDGSTNDGDSIIASAGSGHDRNGTGAAIDGNTMDATNSTLDNGSTQQDLEKTSVNYVYECTNAQYCHLYPPGNSLGLGWNLAGTCQKDVDCPDAYNKSKGLGDDLVMISSDSLNKRVIGSVFCPTGSDQDSRANGEASDKADEDDEVMVPYVYEVETYLVSAAGVFLPRLEEQILLNLADTMMSCYEKERALSYSGSMEFAAKGIRSQPEDVAVTEGPCTFSTPNADNCFVIDGRLTLFLAESTDNSTNRTLAAAVTDVTQYNLRQAMTNNDLLSPKIPEVVKVNFLANTYEDYLSGFVVGESGLAGGAIVAPLPVGEEDKENRGALVGGILGAIFAAIIIMLCALLFFWRRQSKPSELDQATENARRHRDCESRHQADSQAVGGDLAWEDWDESTFDANDPKNMHMSLVAGRMVANDAGEVVLHVNNISPNVMEEDIREVFERHGTVDGCIVPSDYQRGVDPDAARYALLSMPTTNEAELAGAESAVSYVNGSEVDGYILEVRVVTTLYAGNLSPETSEGDVSNLFGQYGPVTGCNIPNDHEEGDDGKRFALATMPIEEATEAILQLHGKEIDGNVLSVRDTKYMNQGRGIPGGGLAAAALAAGVGGAVAGSNKGELNNAGKGDVVLRVSDLHPYTSEEDVRQLFEKHGPVTNCTLHMGDEEGGGSQERFALVTMPADEARNFQEGNDALELDGHVLTVEETQPDRLGIAGRNLMDDVSSAPPSIVSRNFYGAFKSSRLRLRDSGGNDGAEEPRGMLGSLRSAGLSLLGAPVLLLKSFRNENPAEEEEESEKLNYLGSITGKSYGLSPETEESLDDGLETIINTIDGATETRDRRNFVIDPPGAFHLGNHHYTSSGVRYFSPLCELCVAAARADTADGVVALSAVDEEEEDDDLSGGNTVLGSRGAIQDGDMVPGAGSMEADDLSFDLEAAKNFTDFNCNDLGRFHSSMHVRHCKSTTCAICQRAKGVYFVKSRRPDDSIF